MIILGWRLGVSLFKETSIYGVFLEGYIVIIITYFTDLFTNFLAHPSKETCIRGIEDFLGQTPSQDAWKNNKM